MLSSGERWGMKAGDGISKKLRPVLELCAPADRWAELADLVSAIEAQAVAEGRELPARPVVTNRRFTKAWAEDVLAGRGPDVSRNGAPREIIEAEARDFLRAASGSIRAPARVSARVAKLEEDPPVTTFKRLSTVKLGEKRGQPYLYLNGRYLLRASFEPGRLIEATFGPRRVVLRLDPAGSRKVSAKGAERIPVIDINTAELRRAFAGAGELQVKVTTGEIVITPARTAAKVASRVRNGREGSVFAGGGTLTEAARQAGFAPAWAVELDPRYAEVYERNHPGARVLNLSVSEVPTAELDPVELLTIGIPCEPYSTKRRDQPGTKLPPEAHNLGDMVFWALRIVDALNPATVVFEEVPAFLQSGASWVLRHALERMGYTVEARVVDPLEHGELTGRKRAVIVATTGEAFRWPEPAPAPRARQLGEILEEVPASAWFDRASKPWLFAHWEKQAAKGNGFKSQQVTASSSSVGTISRRYFAGQGDCPVVAHPTRPGVFRWFTVGEVKRLHGLPDSYDLGEAKTIAGEILGQGVVVGPFRRIIAATRQQLGLELAA